MSEERLAAIEAREGLLPAGETWDAACMGSEGYDIFARPTGGLVICPPRVARVGYREWPLLAPLAAFIAHSRQDVPQLTAEVRRLRAELASWTIVKTSCPLDPALLVDAADCSACNDVFKREADGCCEEVTHPKGVAPFKCAICGGPCRDGLNAPREVAL